MKYLQTLFLMFTLSTQGLAEPDWHELARLKRVSAQLLGIHAPDYGAPSEVYARYREILKELPFLTEMLSSPQIMQSEQGPILSTFLSALGHTLVGVMGSLTSLGQLGLFPMMFSGMQGWGVPPGSVKTCDGTLLIPDFAIEHLDALINDTMQMFAFSKSPAIQMLLDPQRGLRLHNAPPALATFFRLVLERYFDALDGRSKRAILADMMSLEEDAPAEELLAIVLNRCGPVIQKAFQLFSNDVQSEQLARVLQRLRQNIKIFPTRLAKEILTRETGIDVVQEFPAFPDKPLAAATMGQVYLLENKDGEKLIAKIQRPGVMEKAEKEFVLLRSLTQDPVVLNFLEDLESSFQEEGDFRVEAKNLKAGEFYNGKLAGRLKTIQQWPSYVSTAKVLFLTLAEGKSIATFGADHNDRKSIVLTGLLKVWMQEAIFGERIFHADLHAGNLFFQIKADDPRKDVITLLDFGSLGRFEKSDAKTLFKIIIGLTISSKRLVFEAVQTFLISENVDDLTALRTFVHEIVESKATLADKTKAFFDRSMNVHLRLPKSFVQFYRGQTLLEKQIADIYQSELGAEEGLRESEEILAMVYSEVFKTQILWDLLATACQAQDDCAAYVDNDVVFAYISLLFSGR